MIETRFHWVRIGGSWLPAKRIIGAGPKGEDWWNVLTRRDICVSEEIDEIGPRIEPPAEG